MTSEETDIMNHKK